PGHVRPPLRGSPNRLPANRADAPLLAPGIPFRAVDKRTHLDVCTGGPFGPGAPPGGRPAPGPNLCSWWQAVHEVARALWASAAASVSRASTAFWRTTAHSS